MYAIEEQTATGSDYLQVAAPKIELASSIFSEWLTSEMNAICH